MSGRTIYSIKELNRVIKNKLEADDALQNVWVRGEISNFTHHSSGHMYFTLKDADSRLKSIMFASYNQRLGFIPKEGTKVLACGNISVYERDGAYQFYVTQMQPDGIGSLYLAYEQLKKKLEAEGLFAPERKKADPGFSARDRGHHVADRCCGARHYHYAAAALSVRAGAALSRACAREAGGSFDRKGGRRDEPIKRSGRIDRRTRGRLLGRTLGVQRRNRRACDIRFGPAGYFGGRARDGFHDSRLRRGSAGATPTAAAELAVPHHLELAQRIAHLKQRLYGGLTSRLEGGRERLKRLQRSPYLTNPRRQLMLQPAERLDRMKEQLIYKMRGRVNKSQERLMRSDRKIAAFNPKEQVVYSRKRLDAADRLLRQSMQAALKTKQRELVSTLRQLDALSPLKVMQRGYSLVYDEKEKQLIKSVQQVQLGDIIKLRLADGRIDCHVWSMEEKRDDESGTNNA